MNLKRLSFLAVLVMAALVLAACPAPAPAAPAAEAPAAAEPTAAPAAAAPAAEPEVCAPATDGPLAGVDPRGQTVVWWHNHSGSREEKLLVLLEQFAGNECGITIEAQNQGRYDDIRDKVNASIASGEVPAALLVGYQNDQGNYQINDSLVDLNVYMDDSTWGLSAEEKADFYPVYLNQSIHPLFDNQRLGFPPNRSMEVMYYNQTWLEELGFAGPPTTPDEFKAMACAAAAANGDGTGGFILADDASAMAAWTYAFGGDVLTEDGTAYNYNGQATVDAMTFLKGMEDEGCAYFFTDGYPNPQFAARKALFTMGSSSGIPFYAIDVNNIATENKKDPDAWGVSAIPHTTADPVQNIYGGDVMIAVTTPEQELAAWIFVKWFTSPEIQAQWDVISGYFPTRASTEKYLPDDVRTPQWKQAIALVPFSYYEPQLISYNAARAAVTNAFNAMMQGADVKTTLDDLTTYANEQQAEQMSEIQ